MGRAFLWGNPGSSVPSSEQGLEPGLPTLQVIVSPEWLFPVNDGARAFASD